MIRDDVTTRKHENMVRCSFQDGAIKSLPFVLIEHGGCFLSYIIWFMVLLEFISLQARFNK